MIGVDCFNARKALNAPLNEQLVGCVLEKNRCDPCHFWLCSPGTHWLIFPPFWELKSLL